MPHSFGYRARTRHMFSRDFRKHGMPSLTTYLQTFHVGDLVDIVANGAIHKGMPHKFYHGKTGRVFNVTKRAIGVEVGKIVNGRHRRKMLHIRLEHLVPSKCQDDFKKRVLDNEKLVAEAKAKGVAVVPIKRKPKQPTVGYFLRKGSQVVETVSPAPFVEVL